MMFCLQPHHIGKLPALQELWLDHNQLQHLPSVSDFLTVLCIIIITELFNYLKKRFYYHKKCQKSAEENYMQKKIMVKNRIGERENNRLCVTHEKTVC